MTSRRIALLLVLSCLAPPLAGCDQGAGAVDGGADGAADGGDTLPDDGADAAALAIATATLPDGRVQVDYAAQLETTGAAGPVTWTISSGALPPGLALDADGAISGTPARSGSYAFEVAADDGRATDSAGLTIDVPPVVLMSGFEPFGGYTTNPSWDSIEPFDGMIVSGLDVRIVELPVVWGDAWDVLAAEIDRLHPDVVIATGQAGPEGMRFENYAQNVMTGEDNAGVTMDHQPIVDGGTMHLRTALPVVQMRAAMDAGGYPTLVSSDAGDFLCNYVMYRLLDWYGTTDEPPAAAGFIHVPPVPSTGTMTLDDITAAHRLGLEALATWLASSKVLRPAAADTDAAPQYFGW